ncbi:cytochrome b [Pseudoxanthomonas winnipegensis]|uniref:Cytochrome b n=1 Tax=Pseudoxanthomonas winnipegensis TaxID=2480810 RepID=A0A4Q8M2T9_9GAMM|nr:cytochrome b [Pseudoxanthomonas winnipegensis]TAA39615.1 cytochrome b [Pseudoxanthomonas winnipegensis]
MNASAPPTPWPVAVAGLHWLGVALVLAVAVLGLAMVELERGSDLRKAAYALHKSLGITVLALTTLRIAVRLATRAPPPVAGPAWQQWLARATHLLMYALLLALPLSGWLLNSVAGQPLRWFGLATLPALAGKNPALRAPLGQAHLWLFWTLAGLVALHVLAALYHQWLLHDRTVGRMLPGRRR